MLNNKEKNINYLLQNYSVKSKDEILKDLNLSWSYIQKLACLNGIKKGRNESSNDWKYKKLIDYSDNISMYWVGFMIADGHIYNKSNIQINLSIKDRLHLLKIQEHIGNISINSSDTQIRAVISDRKTASILSNVFNWKSNKTKNPIEIPNFLSKDALFSLIIGFIDGDGTINNKGHIFIKCDKSWKSNLEYFYYILTGEKKVFNLTKDDLSIIYILKLKNLIQIKQKIEFLKLPIMDRKWNRIENKIVKSDKYQIVKEMLNKGYTIKETIDKTKFGQTLVYRVYKEIKDKS